MPTNIPMPEKMVRALQGIPIVMNVPKEELDKRVLGNTVLEDFHAVETIGGIVGAFELTEGEIRAIARGNKLFMIQFINTQLVPPFRLIMEEVPFEINTDADGHAQEVNGHQVGLQEPRPIPPPE